MIFIVLIVGLLLRLISLNQSFWLDEATSGLVVRNFSFSQIVTRFAPGDFHPPLYYLILKAWGSFFGTSEIALRIPSVIFAIATIYVVYLIAKELFNKKTGLVASALLATSGLHVYYSQEARMYALVTLFVSVAVLSFVKTLKRNKIGDWIVLSLSILFLVFTDYVAVFILPVIWLYVLLTKQNSTYWKKFITSHIILLVFIILWLPVFVKQFTSGINISTTSPSWWKVLGLTSIKNIFLIPVKFMLGRISFYNKFIYALVVAFSSFILLIPLTLSLKKYKKTLLVILWLFVPIIGSVVIGIKVSILSYFRLLFCLPAFYILIAFGLLSLKKKLWKPLFLIILFINLFSSGMYLFNQRFQRENWRDLTFYIQAQSKWENSITIFVNDSNMEAYRYYDSDARISGPEGLCACFNEIWLMRYTQPIFDSEDKIRGKVEKLGYSKSGEYDFNGVVVWKYIK